MTKNEIQQRKRQTEAALIATSVMHQLGVISGELPYNQALRIYGGWFKDAVAKGSITPCRVGGAGKHVTRWFSVTSILAQQAEEYERAEVILSK